MSQFGRKTRGARKENNILFCFFHFFASFFSCKPLPGSNLQGAKAFQKNRAKKPTVGFPGLAGFGNIAV
jgi:hypothetical protein